MTAQHILNYNINIKCKIMAIYYVLSQEDIINFKGKVELKVK